MGVLPGSEVLIKFLLRCKNGYARQRLNDREYFQNLRLHSYERGLSTSRLNDSSGVCKHTQSGAADEPQSGKIEHHVLNWSTQDGRELPFQIRSRGGVQTST